MTQYPQSDIQTKFLKSTTNLSPITLLVTDLLPNAHSSPLKINPMHRNVNCEHVKEKYRVRNHIDIKGVIKEKL
jgi:hypothetical protein